MKQYKIYRTIHKLPIFNYNQVMKTGDLRYLLILDDYSDLPEFQERKTGFMFRKLIMKNYDFAELKLIWETLLYEFEKDTINIEIIRLKREMWLTYRDWYSGGNEQKYHNAFALYRKELDKGIKSVKCTPLTLMQLHENNFDDHILTTLLEIVNREYSSISGLYNHLKQILKLDDVIRIRPYILEYADIDIDIQYSLIDELTTIEQILGITIDEHTTTVAKYMAYKKKAQSIIKRREQAAKQKDTAKSPKG